MSARALLVLATLTVLAVGGVIVTRGPGISDRPRLDEGRRFLPDLEARVNDVNVVRVRRAGGELLARLERDGDAWRVANRHDYPADSRTLRGTLIGLARADRVERKTRRPDGYARLGVQDIERPDAGGIEITLEGIDPVIGVIIGKPSTGDVGGTYVRRVGEERAWLVSGEIERHDAVADWLDDRLVDIPAQSVRRVRIESVDGDPVVVDNERAGSAAFELNVPEGRYPLSNSIAQSLARIVTGLGMTDVRPAADMPDLPRLAVARFETFEGLVVVIEGFADGRKGESRRFVRLSAETADRAGSDVRARAEGLNARFRGWVYELPEYKFVNATQTLEGVLEPRAKPD